MFGHLGAAFVPRGLADHGCADRALKIFTQEQFPGWGWMVRHGASGLWENWNGKSSGNHVLFADPSAWLTGMEEAFGIRQRIPAGNI